MCSTMSVNGSTSLQIFFMILQLVLFGGALSSASNLVEDFYRERQNATDSYHVTLYWTAETGDDMKCHEISFSPSVDHSIVKAELRLGVVMARLDKPTWRGRPRYVIRSCVEAGNQCALLDKRAILTREEVIKVPIEVGKLRKYLKIRVRVRDRRRRQWVDCNQWPFVHSNNKDKYTALLLIYREASSSSNFFRNLFG